MCLDVINSWCDQDKPGVQQEGWKVFNNSAMGLFGYFYDIDGV